ncbi:MAG: insulinase family protein, partial [Anaerolineales bacterium]
YYVPSNAVLAVAGHFNASEMLAMIAELFGEIPPQPEPTDSIPLEPPMGGERRIVVNGPGETELLYVAYRAPSADNPDFLPLAVLNSILAGAVSLILVGGGLSNQTSRLYRALVESNLAATLGATLSATIDPFLYHFGMAVRSDGSAESLLSALDDEMARLMQEPITQKELDKAIKQAQALHAYGNETSYRLAFGMGYAAVFPEIAWLQDPLGHLARVTIDQVMEAAHKYLDVSNRIVGFYKPNGGGG